MFSTETDIPIRICALLRALFKSNLVLRVKVNSLKLTNSDINSFKFNIFGLPFTMAKVLNPNEVSTEVSFYNCLLTVSGSIFLLKSITTLTPL